MLEKPSGIPRQSGCYLFRNAAGTIIYVGKARVLAQRLSSYFQRESGLSQKTQLLMADAASVEWIVTPTELDALILENELIKDNQPRYNMRLKDDKSFPFVALDGRTPFPAPYITRASHVKGVRYFGPFADVRALRVTMDELLQAFPLRSCSKHKFLYQQRIGRPCLLYDIGKCSGPCVGHIDEEGYAQLVQSWARFFEGDVRQLRDLLQHQMREASERQHYEAAAKARDGLEALERAAGAQSVVLDDHTNLDVFALASEGSRAALVRFRVRFGRVIGRTVHLVDRSMDEDDEEILENVLTDLYFDAESVPAVVVVQHESLATPLVAAYLASVRGRPVEVTVAQRGRRRRVVELAASDAQSVIDRDSLRRQADHNVRARALQELGTALGLEQPPYRVECFDMSHLQGTNYVGSMVVFEDALPIKRDYRHFNVREVLGNDDVGAMEEVVRRRLSHWEEHQGTSKFRRADLIIIDGGLPQLHAAEKAARTLGLSGLVEFTALAKREELLYRPGTSVPVALERGSESLYLVQRIRDEAHRFAITFHRSKRGRSMVASSLEGIDGLGPARRERLLGTFGSLNALRQATFEELDALAWLPSDVATRLYDHLRAPTAPRPTKGSDDE
ncbi:MAG TPA: excinuclease ABC subunit UvrC [Acidimicrobiales bacterium]|jgi:excinuclease ABC subunit C|nr:excinuclease ABC subunit UvrC [Acidimicrobiales bacterium]